VGGWHIIAARQIVDPQVQKIHVGWHGVTVAAQIVARKLLH
jgi:hypothetical protein